MTKIFKTIFMLWAFCLLWMGLEFLIYGQIEDRLVDNIVTIFLIPIFYSFVNEKDKNRKGNFMQDKGQLITDMLYKRIRDEAYEKGRIEQAKADAEYVQEIKDKYNDNRNFGDKSMSINYGTICDITCHFWKQLSDLKSEDTKHRYGESSN